MDWQSYLAWLAISSGVTFMLYGFDKARAKVRGWRVPEVVLHGLALAGGFGGGWAGRRVFRHKTRKASFALVLAGSTAVHLALAYWLFLR